MESNVEGEIHRAGSKEKGAAATDSATASDSPSTEHQERKLQIGVSFCNIDCNGFLESSQHQETFASVLAKPLNAIRDTKRKIAILHHFNGLVRHGEMLLVLGRPGSGCSTLLKALAGETHGFQIRPQAGINYQGEQTRALCKGLLTHFGCHRHWL